MLSNALTTAHGLAGQSRAAINTDVRDRHFGPDPNQPEISGWLSKPAPFFNSPRRRCSSVFHVLRSSENLLISNSKCLRIHGLMDFFFLGLLTTNSHIC
ncbi:hypothetical protein QYF36_007542 [Acer negundo]|nr:hypothetical protein QYF36_007542 [Acer negundo]